MAALTKEDIKDVLDSTLGPKDQELAKSMRDKIELHMPRVRLKTIQDVRVAYEIERLARGVQDKQTLELSGEFVLTWQEPQPQAKVPGRARKPSARKKKAPRKK
ncbi:MAG: hypothetical protein KAR06_01190 [Deltaproteobacteria bacterium]|nr:hypothetical protein [Deltaproteobacteria bacterium]